MENRCGLHQIPRIVLGPFPNMLNAPPADTQQARTEVDLYSNKVPVRVLGPFRNIPSPVQPVENYHSNISTRSKNSTIGCDGEFGFIGQKKWIFQKAQLPPPTVGHSNGAANVCWPTVRKEILPPPPPPAWLRQPPPPVHTMRRMSSSPPAADNSSMWIHQSKLIRDHRAQVCTRFTGGWPLYCAQILYWVFYENRSRYKAHSVSVFKHTVCPRRSSHFI